MKKRNRVFRTFRFVLLIVVVSILCTEPVFFGPNNAVVLAQQKKNTNNVSNVSVRRSYVWPAIVVVVLFGGAIFVVCKSSNRS